MASPVSNHLVSGTVRDRLGNILAGATVTLTHTITPVISTTTGSDGKYILNLSGLSSQWIAGQEITLFSTTQFKGRKSTTVAISTGASQTVNLTMEETSDFVFATNSQDRYNLNFALITTYDGEKVTSTNPLPVSVSLDIDLLYNPSLSRTITRADGNPDSETVTLANGDIYKRTMTYKNPTGALLTRSRWIKQ